MQQSVAGMYYAQQQQQQQQQAHVRFFYSFFDDFNVCLIVCYFSQQPQYMQYPTGYPQQAYGQPMYYLPQTVPISGGIAGSAAPSTQQAVHGLPPAMYPHMTQTSSPRATSSVQTQQGCVGGGGSGGIRHSNRQYQLQQTQNSPVVSQQHGGSRPAQFVQYYVGASPQMR
jgi:hypothetical protein